MTILILPFLLQQPTRLALDLAAPGIKVSPTLYGHMTEEINYSYDGGLYAELVRNRAFLDDPRRPNHWTAVDGGTAELERSGPTAARPMALKVSGGVANDGYWGIPVKPATTYSLTIWAKADKAGPLSASIESADGATVYAKASIGGANGDWRKLTATLRTAANAKATTDGRLVLRTGPSQTVWFSQVSLFPPTYNGRANGNRPDLMKMLIDMKPRFLRFPGGNYLEGNTPADYFPWKTTLGPIEGRPGHKSPWGYRSTDGMGLLEFLLWCEESGAKPLLAVYAGYALNGQVTKAGPELERFVQDALDEIEYVTGGVDTTWGAKRVQDGHPKPFPLEWVEIGNEDGFDKSGSYEGRFVQFFDAIKKKYPRIKVISSTGGKDWLGAKFPITQRKPDLWDEHYYSEAWDMMGMANKYDSYDRTGPKVFVGEWAAHDTIAPWAAGAKAGPTPNMKCTLGDAAFMTGLERNSDVVEMACYAPLLVNANPGGRQWSLNLIGYDNSSVFGSPSYYAQKMFAENIGDRTVPIQLSGVPVQTQGDKKLPAVFASATRDSQSGAIYVKLVNALPSPQPVSFDVKGGKLRREATMTTLNGEPKTMNSLAEPTKIAPKSTVVRGVGGSFSVTLPAFSVSVLTLKGERRTRLFSELFRRIRYTIDWWSSYDDVSEVIA